MTYEEARECVGMRFRLISLASSSALSSRMEKAIGKTGVITYVGPNMGPRDPGFPINVEWDGDDSYGINSLIGGFDRIEVYDEDGEPILFPSEMDDYVDESLIDPRCSKPLYESKGLGDFLCERAVRMARNTYGKNRKR